MTAAYTKYTIYYLKKAVENLWVYYMIVELVFNFYIVIGIAILLIFGKKWLTEGVKNVECTMKW